MSTLGTLALSGGEAAFFALPPRPPRRERAKSRPHALGHLVRVIRQELADATTGSRTDAVPELRNYPY